jgi:hypothetical protein
MDDKRKTPLPHMQELDSKRRPGRLYGQQKTPKPAFRLRGSYFRNSDGRIETFACEP